VSELISQVADRADERAASRRRAARLRILLAVASVVVTVAAGASLLLLIPGTDPRSAGGTVSCESGSAVQGVWVGRSRYDGTFVEWKPDPHDASTASFEAYVTTTAYVVHIGCGGSPESWAVTGQSSFVTGSRVDIVCLDGSPREDRVAPCVERDV
jgi:hypothetical protein